MPVERRRICTSGCIAGAETLSTRCRYSSVSASKRSRPRQPRTPAGSRGVRRLVRVVLGAVGEVPADVASAMNLLLALPARPLQLLHLVEKAVDVEFDVVDPHGRPRPLLVQAQGSAVGAPPCPRIKQTPCHAVREAASSANATRENRASGAMRFFRHSLSLRGLGGVCKLCNFVFAFSPCVAVACPLLRANQNARRRVMARPKKQKAQEQDQQPGIEAEMQPRPEFIREGYRGSGRLEGKHALITGGDSGIGRAVAVHFAAEGAASVGIVYLDEHGDAEETARLVGERGARCIPIQGDITDPDCAPQAVEKFMQQARAKSLDVLVNNAAAQWPQENIEEIDLELLERTFRTNIFSYFLFTQA